MSKSSLFYDEEAERGLLGACLFSPHTALAACQQSGLVPEAFSVPSHRVLFETMLAIALPTSPDRVDLLAVLGMLKDKQLLDVVGGREYLDKLIDDAIPTHADYYLQLVLEHHLRRVLSAETQAIQHALENDQQTSPVEIISGTISRFANLCATSAMIRSPAEIYNEQRELWHKAKDGGTSGYPSRWQALEQVVGGYVAPEYVVIAGAPSDGKTTMACCELRHLAESRKVPVGIISLEMTEGQLREKLIAERAGVDAFKLRRGVWTPADLQAMDRSAEVVNALPIYITDGPKTIGQIQAWMLQASMRYGCKVFAVDYIQAIRDTDQPAHRSRNEIVARWSGLLKSMGQRLDAVVLALCQLARRGHRDRTDTPPVPSLEALRDSGSIEQDADVVIMIAKRPGLTIAEHFRSDADWPMVWDVAKHRNGPTGEVAMLFRRTLQRYVPQVDAVSEVKGDDM